MGLTPKQFAENLIRKWKGTLYIPTVEHQIYSTEETVIGSYMGKPLYRKVYEGNIGTISKVPHDMIIDNGFNSNTHVLCDFRGAIKAVNGAEFSANATFGSSSERFGFWLGCSKTSLNIAIYAATTGGVSWLNNATFSLIVEYTKVADTTSSPKVPYEPLHEWSTEEKLVGYDEEGNAVYRQTVKTDVFSYTSNVVVQKTFPFAGKNVRSISGGFKASPSGTSGHCFLPFVGSTAGNPSNNTITEYYCCFVWANTLYFSYKRPDTSGGTAQGIAVIEYTKTTD